MNITEQTWAKLHSSQDLHQFLHQIINNLTQKHTQNLDPDLHQVATYLQEFYTKKTLDQNTNLPQTVPGHIRIAVEKVFGARRADLLGHVIKEKMVQSGRSVVENFDWKVKWILGSSKVAELQEPLCQVDLICLELGPDLSACKRVVSFECDLQGIEQLISVLEKCK